MKRVVTALNNPYINEYLKENYPEIKVQIRDIQYQEAVLEMIETIKQDVLILSELLPGELSKKDFIEKIRELNEEIKIIMIIEKEDKDFKKFLASNSIFEIFIDREVTIENLTEAIFRENAIIIKQDSEQTKKLEQKVNDLENLLNQKPKQIKEMITKIEKQEIIAVSGIGGVGKSDVITQLVTVMAEKAESEILLFDMDTFQASIYQYFGINKTPDDMGFIIDENKKASFNYIVDALDRRKLNSNNFKTYLIKDTRNKNLDILTGNNSLYDCKEMLSDKYYKAILNFAKEMYQYIFIDSSNNIFLDSTRFVMLNASKIFFVIEGTYINIKRSLEILDMYVNIWNVKRDAISIIVNKYNSDCLDKEIIEELMGGYPIIAYIPYDSKHTMYLNKGIPMATKCMKKDKEPYLKIIEQFNFIKKRSLYEKIFSKKDKVEIKFENPNVRSESI